MQKSPDEMKGILDRFFRSKIDKYLPYQYETPVHIAHKCKNGNIGVLHFIGYKK